MENQNTMTVMVPATLVADEIIIRLSSAPVATVVGHLLMPDNEPACRLTVHFPVKSKELQAVVTELKERERFGRAVAEQHSVKASP